MLTVRTLMTSVVLTLSIGDTLAQAEAHLKRNNFRHLPVVDGLERLVGLVTHRMVLAAWVGRLEPRFERPGDVASQVPIEMIMEREVVSVSPDTPPPTPPASRSSASSAACPSSKTASWSAS